MTDRAFASSSLRSRLLASTPLASLAAFRILFGLLMMGGTIRFVASGWVEELFVRPRFFFKYSGFEWMPVWDPMGLYIHMAVVTLSALCVALGFYYRASLIIFMLSFLGVQLFDLSNYLNHYYLVLCLGTVLLLLPANAMWSIDAKRNPKIRCTHYPAWGLYLLRFQVALVYIFAAAAKTGTDWLLHAQPLSIWLSARQEMPILGDFFASPYTAYIMSWGGFLYDLTIVIFLLWAKTRALAYVAVVGFHVMTHLLFDIGMFPFIMVVATTIFFAPDWPLKWAKQREDTAKIEPTRSLLSYRLTVIVAFLWCGFHVIFPLRQAAYASDVLWSEQGMRYSWRVMVREKMGSITYLVERVTDGKVWEVNPSAYLEPRQLSEMSSQPDLIRQLAFHIKNDFKHKRGIDVRVRVRALVSLNGRAPALLIDPTVDLTTLDPTRDGWILPKPETPPLSPWGGMNKGTH